MKDVNSKSGRFFPTTAATEPLVASGILVLVLVLLSYSMWIKYKLRIFVSVKIDPWRSLVPTVPEYHITCLSCYRILRFREVLQRAYKCNSYYVRTRKTQVWKHLKGPPMFELILVPATLSPAQRCRGARSLESMPHRPPAGRNQSIDNGSGNLNDEYFEGDTSLAPHIREKCDRQGSHFRNRCSNRSDLLRQRNLLSSCD